MEAPNNSNVAQALIGGRLAPVDLIASWPLVKVPANIASELHFACAGCVPMRHMSDANPSGQGQSLWWAALPGHRVVGIAFQWRRAVRDVVVIEDPMAVVTNMLLQQGDEYLSETAHAQVLISLLARHYRVASGVSLVGAAPRSQ